MDISKRMKDLLSFSLLFCTNQMQSKNAKPRHSLDSSETAGLGTELALGIKPKGPDETAAPFRGPWNTSSIKIYDNLGI
jgi:hypothetical protein